MARGRGLGRGITTGKGGSAPSTISAQVLLTGNTIPEDTGLGVTVGTFSVQGVTGVPIYSLVNDAGSKFALSGANLITNDVYDYETTTSYNITVGVAGVAPAIANRVFTIYITDVYEPPVIYGRYFVGRYFNPRYFNIRYFP